jgi:hypothetical protein
MNTVSFHPLAIRASDDDPGTYVVGRPVGGEFVELPAIGVDAIRLLDDGVPVDSVEQRLAGGGDRPDVRGLVEALAELGFVAAIDGEATERHPGAGGKEHFGWLKQRHARWLFGRTAKVLYALLVFVTLWTLWRRPGLLPGYGDFFWGGTVGLAVLVNTAMFVASAGVHELMHLAAARSLGVPARIGFGTRLHNLVLQTDVSAAWTLPRRSRYRIYLAGMLWDTAALCTALLLIAHADFGSLVDGLLGAYVLMVVLSLSMQIQVYMRTDMYFVLLDLLRCGDLFHDGMAYSRYLAARVTHRLRLRHSSPPDPARELAPRERRAVRIYAPLLVLGSTIALAVYACYGIPILVLAAVRAFAAITAGFSGGSLLAAADGALVLLVEGGLQVVFLATFYRNRRAWFRRVGARLRRRGRIRTGVERR